MVFKSHRCIIIFKLLVVVYVICSVIIWMEYYINKDIYLAGMTEVKGWYRNTPRDTKLYIQPNKQTTRILPTEFCNKETTLVIIVCSYYRNFAQRVAIRETWGSLRKVFVFTLNVYFLLGETVDHSMQKLIEAESTKYNDIIQEHFIDSYYNLTIKTLMLLKIVNFHCLYKTSYVMKVDDDVYINLGQLVHVLKNKTSENLLLGHLFQNIPAVKDVHNKWNAPYYLYDKKYYPNFLSGTGYVISIDLAPRLYTASLEAPVYHLEDVYITGILAQKIFVEPIDSEHFHVAKKIFACFMTTAVTAHGHSDKELLHLYQFNQKYNITKRCKMKVIQIKGYLGYHRICSCRRK